MTSIRSYIELIPYDEMANILKGKFKATHDEIRYWIKRATVDKWYEDVGETTEEHKKNDSLLCPYLSDIPTHDELIIWPENHLFFPEYFFYDKQYVNQFKPFPHFRFVYQRDLSIMRNWNDPLIFQTLINANLKGILNIYNTSTDSFTISNPHNVLWGNTFQGEDYIKNPDSFFLLYDIINIERIFFNKDRNLCLQELGLKVDRTSESTNVYNFKKKKVTKEIDNE